MIELLKNGGTCQVPRNIATCPECDSRLHVTVNAWDEETGRPLPDDLQIDCCYEAEGDEKLEDDEIDRAEYRHQYHHRHWQSDWQPRPFSTLGTGFIPTILTRSVADIPDHKILV